MTRQLKQILLVEVILALSMTWATGATWYVEPVQGVDAIGNGTLASPLKTLIYAYNVIAQEFDTIVLLPGIYSQTTNGEWFPIHATTKDVVIQEGQCHPLICILLYFHVQIFIRKITAIPIATELL